MKPGISVIIPSYNGAHRISGVLEALLKQSIPASEVIVVIDGSKDNTLNVVEAYKNRLPLKILNIPNKGRAGARNTGVAHAEFSLLLFLDDDMRPFHNCIRDHQVHHEKFPGCLLVGHITEDVELFTSDIQQYRIKLYDRKGWVREVKDVVPLKENEFFLAAANLSMLRSTFDGLKGFDETLTDAEDFDLGTRAFAKGIEIYHVSKFAGAYHDDLITCKSYISRQREYLKSLEKLYHLKPEMYKKYLHRIHPAYSIPKRIIYSLISNKYTVSMVDRGIFKYLLPDFIKHRLYDHIINGLIQVYPDRKLN